MNIIEFDADIIDGAIIPVPEKYKNELKKQDNVHVVLLPREQEHRPTYDAIRDLIDHPLTFSGGRIPTRDEMHERH